MFYLIDFDGWNVGVAGDFHSTFLEFDGDLELAQKVIAHWNKWAGVL